MPESDPNAELRDLLAQGMAEENARREAVAASGSPPSTETALAAARWDALMDNVSSTSLEPDEIRLHLIGVTLPDLFGPHKVDWSMRTCHDIADKLMARAASGSTGAPSDQPTPETEK